MRFNWHAGSEPEKESWFEISDDFEYMISEKTKQRYKLVKKGNNWAYYIDYNWCNIPNPVNGYIEKIYAEYILSKYNEVDILFLKIGYAV